MGSAWRDGGSRGCQDGCGWGEKPAEEAPKEAPKEEKKKKKKKKKGGCAIDGCTGRVVALIGDCKYCKKSYCQEHRLPESHACPELKSCRERAFDLNAGKVGAMKCVAVKQAAC